MKLNEHINRMKKGDFSRYEEFNEITKKYIYNLVYMITQEEDSANEAFAAVYNDIYKDIAGLSDEEDFLRWAGIKCINAAFAIMKRKYPGMLNAAGNKPRGVDFDNACDDIEKFIPQGAADNMKLAGNVMRTVANLSVIHRAVMQLFYNYGLDVHEVTGLLGVDEARVKGCIMDLRELLKIAIADIYGENSENCTSLSETPLFWNIYRAVYTDDLTAEASGMAVGAAAGAGIGVATGAVAAGTTGASAAAAGTTGVSAATAGAAAVSSAAVTGTAAASSTVAAGAATGFFATMAGKLTVGIAALAVAGSIGGAALYNHNKNKDNNKSDNVRVEASTAAAVDDQSDKADGSGNDGAQADQPDITEPDKDMYNVRSMTFREKSGNHTYIYIDGDGYDELKESVEADNAQMIDYVNADYDSYGGDFQEAAYWSGGLASEISRSDSRILSITYEESGDEYSHKSSENYDVNTGKKLTIQELGINEEDFRTLVKNKLTEVYRTGTLKDAAWETDDKDALFNAAIEARASKACEIILGNQSSDYVSYECSYYRDDYPVSFSDNIDWTMNHDGVVVYWNTNCQMYGVDTDAEIVIPYSEFSSFNEAYLPDDDTFSGELGSYSYDKIVVDVNSDGYDETLSFGRAAGDGNSNSTDYGVFVNWDGAVIDGGYGTSGTYARTSDGKSYMIVSSKNSYIPQERDYDNIYVNEAKTYIYDVSSGTPVRVDDGCNELYVCSMTGDYAFCQDVVTGEYGYYALTDTGLAYQPDMYKDDTEKKRAYEAYIKYIEMNDRSYENTNYGLIYVDDDDIPELAGLYQGVGGFICAYKKNQLTITDTGFSFDDFNYKERKGMFFLGSGRQGIFYDFYYEVTEDGIEEKAVGRREMLPDGENITWNDEEVSASEYEKKADEIYGASGGDTTELSEVCTMSTAQILNQMK